MTLKARLARMQLQWNRALLCRAARVLGLRSWVELPRLENLPVASAICPAHVVVYRVGNIGDTVAALPALAAIRERFPVARLTLVTSAGNPDLPGAAEVLSSFPALVDTVVTYLPFEIKSWQGLQRLKKRVHEAGGPVDLFVDLPVTLQTLRRGLQELGLARLFGARQVSGFDLLLPSLFRPEYARCYADDLPRTADWLASLAVGKPPARLPHPAVCEEALPEDLAFSADSPLLVVNAGAKLAVKRWAPSAFAEVLRCVAAEYPALQVLLLGSDAEWALNEEIKGFCGLTHIQNCAGRLDLSKTWAVLARADVVLSNDTGPMHMAAMLEKPVVIPMAGQFPAPLWHPAGDSLISFRHAMACAPCFLDICPYAEEGLSPCLAGISAETVANAVITALSSRVSLNKPSRAGV